MTVNLPWIEKYRPKHLNDLVSHEDIIHSLQKFVSNGGLPHLLFYGPPGTGKTSSILAIAKEIYGNNMKSLVLELNASDDRGINVVRSEILNFASNVSLNKSHIRLIILDEADAMTKDAQNALKRIIEKYSKHTRFCLICNFQNKIIPAIQSRCTRFRFSPLKNDQMRPRLNIIIKEENLNVTSDGLEAIIHLSNGDMRQAINILQSASMAFSIVNETNAYACVGKPEPNDMKVVMNMLFNDDVSTCHKKLCALQLDKAVALSDIVTQLHRMLIKVRLPNNVLVELMIQLAEVEKSLANGCADEMQSGSIISAFVLVRDKIMAVAQ